MLFSIVAAPTHSHRGVGWPPSSYPRQHVLFVDFPSFLPFSPFSLTFFPFLSRFFLLFSSFGSNILPYFLYFNLLSLTPF